MLLGSNWNNRSNARVRYRNSNNNPSNNNRNIGTHIELRDTQSLNSISTSSVSTDKHTTKGLPRISTTPGTFAADQNQAQKS